MTSNLDNCFNTSGTHDKGIATKNTLITGPPGCGKSTLIERIVLQVKGPITGFFTSEIREEGRRDILVDKILVRMTGKT